MKSCIARPRQSVTIHVAINSNVTLGGMSKPHFSSRSCPLADPIFEKNILCHSCLACSGFKWVCSWTIRNDAGLNMLPRVIFRLNGCGWLPASPMFNTLSTQFTLFFPAHASSSHASPSPPTPFSCSRIYYAYGHCRFGQTACRRDNPHIQHLTTGSRSYI